MTVAVGLTIAARAKKPPLHGRLKLLAAARAPPFPPVEFLATAAPQRPHFARRHHDQAYASTQEAVAVGLVEQLDQIFVAHDVEYAITHEVAGQRYAPFLSRISQVRCGMLTSPVADQAIGELGARVVFTSHVRHIHDRWLSWGADIKLWRRHERLGSAGRPRLPAFDGTSLFPDPSAPEDQR